MDTEEHDLSALKARFEPARQQYLQLRYPGTHRTRDRYATSALAAAAAIAALAIGVSVVLWEASFPNGGASPLTATRTQFADAMTMANARPAMSVSLRPKVALHNTGWRRTAKSGRLKLPMRPTSWRKSRRG